MWEKYPFINKELAALEEYLLERFPRKGGFLDDVSQSVIKSGGKRLRPLLAILTSMFGDYDRNRIFPVAAAIETLHTATLVHDDIIDNAETRRGMPSVSAKHGIDLAVYTGDYLLVKSVLLLSEAGLPPDKLNSVARALEQMWVGEVEQYIGRHRIPSPREYLKRIMRKTGILLSASCALGAYASGCSDEQVKKLGRFGMYFGAAYQIRDDLLDLEAAGNKVKIGKPVIHDLKEGFVTLPVIYAVRKDKALSGQLEELFEGRGHVNRVISGIIASGGTKEAGRIKERYGQKCLDILQCFPVTEHRRAMEDTVLWLLDGSRPVPV